ncbi:sigma factor [Nonomuraea sp. NPDC048892]|uniref:sigma factor n=1 Tax=Nonomuraea sp. NPDC048892 TaxID=3154624 RepID=UPI0033C38A72
MADRSEYDAFVEASWHRLLRTAYLLARDWGVAEDLVQTALLKAWQVWPRLEAEREAYVRKIIVRLHISWWRFGVYEWTPPATPQPPAPPVEPPATISAGSLHLVTKGSATWPGTREVTLTVPDRGRRVAIVTYCGDGLAGRLTTDVWVNGRPIKGPHDCAAPPTPAGPGSSSWAGNHAARRR